MRSQPIESVAIDENGRLLVRPVLSEGNCYSLIYRAGNGLRWEPGEKAIVATEPKRWEHIELLAHVVKTLAEECDERLHAVGSTRWLNMSRQQAGELRAVVSRSGSTDA
jgi:hypothetical protein